MATEKQIAANRANAKRSTGPKTAAGKERSSRNAYQHGLSGLGPPDDLSAAMVNEITRAIAADQAIEYRLTIARDFAHAQAELVRIQAIRTEQWSKIKLDDALDEDAKNVKRLASLDRYERYALTKRRKALKKLGLNG